MKTVAALAIFVFSSLALGETMNNQNSDSKVIPQQDPIAISSAAFDASQVPFESHDNYLSMPTPYEPVKPFFDELTKRVGLSLKNRGEAHITVVTPPEFTVLNEKITMAEIDAIAAKFEMQKSKVEPYCLGQGSALVEGNEERTYFIVVRSENLFAIRREIQKLFESKGGKGFVASLFYPHITIGFTKSDLHIHQGVKKGEDSCVFPIRLK